MCLYNQPYIRNESLTVEDLVKLSISQLSENIRINRNACFVIDESSQSDRPPDSGSGVLLLPFPSYPNPLTEEAELE